MIVGDGSRRRDVDGGASIEDQSYDDIFEDPEGDGDDAQ
jgi:hypothetical protein